MKTPTTETPPTCKSWRELAGRLLTTDRSLRLWRARPGAPKTPDLIAWRSYTETEGLGRIRGNELTELRKDVEREKLRRLRRENEIAEAKLIPRELLSSVIRGRAHAFVSASRMTLENELPPRLQGASIAEIRATMRDAVDLLIRRYNGEFDADEIAKEAIAGNV